MQVIDRQIYLKATKLFLLYEAVLAIGFIVSLIHINTSLYFFVWNFLGEILAITLSLVFSCLLAAKLSTEGTLTAELNIYLLLSLVFAAVVNAQVTFAILIVFATNFLYYCYPFRLCRKQVFMPIKYAINTAIIFFATLFTLCNLIGMFPILVFIVTYSAAITIKSICTIIHDKAVTKKLVVFFKICVALAFFFVSSFMYMRFWVWGL